MMLKLGLGGLVVAVILAECCVAYLFLPSEAEVQAMAVAKVEAEEEKEAEAVEAAEVDLGMFNVSVSQPNSSATLRIDFHLYGTVLSSEKIELDTQYTEKLHRFRDLVITEVLTADRDDLVHSRLGLIKRRILEKSNLLFGKPLIKSVVLSNYSFVDQ
ncbi:hypothetical protein [Lignipirellula cremea]|nr:hypothetical protein [Lignipirellula cremea]